MASLGILTAREHGFKVTRAPGLNHSVGSIPIDSHKNMGPGHSIVAGAMEIGAAWKRLCSTNRLYLSANLDSSFAAPVDVRRIRGEDASSSCISSSIALPVQRATTLGFEVA